MQSPRFPNSLHVCLRATLLVAVSVFAGCAGSHRNVSGNLARSTYAPDDAPRHPNRNALYTMPDATPRLVARPTVEDAARAQPCDKAALSVSEIAANVNGDYRSVKLAFSNRGATACTLGGYPAIALMGVSGERIGSIAIEKTTSSVILAEMSETHTASASDSPASDSAPAVVLMPHGAAAFEVAWKSGEGCPVVSHIEVAAPGTTGSFPITHPLTVCAGQIQITALRLDEGAA